MFRLGLSILAYLYYDARSQAARDGRTLSSPAARQSRPTLSRAEKPEKRQHCGRSGAAPCCVAVDSVSSSATQTPRQSDQAAPRRRADAAKYHPKQRPSSDQSTAFLTCIEASAATQRLSSPAARQLRPTLSRAGEPEKRQHCGRSGAALCCVAVDLFQLLDTKRRARATKPRHAGEPTPPTLTSRATFQRPEYCLPHASQQAQQHNDQAHPPPEAPERSEARAKWRRYKRSGASP